MDGFNEAGVVGVDFDADGAVRGDQRGGGEAYALFFHDRADAGVAIFEVLIIDLFDRFAGESGEGGGGFRFRFGTLVFAHGRTPF